MNQPLRIWPVWSVGPVHEFLMQKINISIGSGKAQSQNPFNKELVWAIFYETESKNWAGLSSSRIFWSKQPLFSWTRGNLAAAKPKTKVIVQTSPNLRSLIIRRAHHRTFFYKDFAQNYCPQGLPLIEFRWHFERGVKS